MDISTISSPRAPEKKQLSILRGSWELASVLHFLNVFRPVLDLKLKFSMEELESALLMPNALLDNIHIGLLKEIPPISKSAISRENWVAVLCTKLKDWWQSVAQGPFPLVSKRGEEVATYKGLCPNVRAVILKALCEARLDQEDIRVFIGEKSKQENLLSIRKQCTGCDMQGTTYWYENDRIAGQRLYRELWSSDTKDGAQVMGHSVSPPATCQWETLATNLDEFRNLADKFCSSRNKMEVVIGQRISSDIIPDLLEAEKRRERAVKRQMRQALLLEIQCNTAASRPRRERKPVSYTFDAFDNSINEALRAMKGLSGATTSSSKASAGCTTDMEVDGLCSEDDERGGCHGGPQRIVKSGDASSVTSPAEGGLPGSESSIMKQEMESFAMAEAGQ